MTDRVSLAPIHDVLLSYLSEKGHGNWSDIVDAWNWLAPDREPADKAWIVIRDLSALGHLEVAWADDGITWSAPPPVITMIPRSGGRAFISGARSRDLYMPAYPDRAVRPGGESAGRLLEVVEAMNLWVDEIENVNAPTTLYVACETSSDASELADALGINYTFSVASQLSQILPTLDRYTDLWDAGELPIGFDVEVFNTNILKWVATDTTDEVGLYRAATEAQVIHGLHGPVPGSWRRVTREHGIYEVLRWEVRHVMHYNPVACDLAVPVHSGLPMLQARAAVLSSGRLPSPRSIETAAGRDLYSTVFPNVTKDVAERIAFSLNQQLNTFNE